MLSVLFHIPGLKFWKSPRRKFLAVTMQQRKGESKGKKCEHAVVTLESDKDFLPSREKVNKISSFQFEQDHTRVFIGFSNGNQHSTRLRF